MPEVVTEDFHKSLKSSPTGKRKNGTLFDEMYASLETSEKPLDKAIQFIAEFHGPWNGSSRELTDFITFLASAKDSALLKNLSIQKANAACEIQNVLTNLPPSSIGKSDPRTFAIMPNPLLREFINRSQKLHPAINMYIQMHIGTFPYYQQISEDIGQYAAVTMNTTEIDPILWPNSNGISCSTTNSRLSKRSYLKMLPEVFNLMDSANNLVNAMYLRSMQTDNNMSLLHTGYSRESPIPHGHNFSMDVHNAQRKRAASDACLAAVINLTGDAIRLLNKFFCIKELARYDVESFQITMNEGPNGEPVTYIVDQNNRPMFDGETSNKFNDPTNDRVVNTKEEYRKEKQ